MSMAEKYARFIESGGEPLIGHIHPHAASSVSGPGYAVLWFKDESLIAVLGERAGAITIVDRVDEPCTQNAYETLTHAASCMARLSRDERAKFARAEGATPGGPVTISGVRWTYDGDYAGLAWTHAQPIGGAA